MIISLDSCYKEKLLNKNLTNDELIKLENIFCLCYKNKLFFKADRDFYSIILVKYRRRFSSFSISYLESIVNNYTVVMGDIKGIDPLITLSDNGFNELSLNSYAICSLVNLPDNLEPILYCENIYDADFYIKMFYFFEGNSQDVFISKDSFSGGNIESIKNKIKERRIIFCICDSDKYYSNCKYGSTASSIRDLFLTERHEFSYYYILNVREIENLLPFEVLDNISFEDEVKKLIEVLKTKSDETRDFFDLKDGYSKEDRARYNKDSDWLKANGTVIKAMQRYKMYHNEKGSRKLIKGIGSNAIRRACEKGIPLIISKDKMTKNQLDDLNNITSQIRRYGFIYRLTLS